MPASTATPLHAQARLTAGIVARCAGVTLASAPLAWLCATLLSHRTLPEHEKVVAIALTVLALGAAIHYARQSWTWSGIFLSALLVFPSALDRRCLLLGSLAAPMLTTIALHAWVTRRAKVIVLASMMATLMAALGASALLTPWPGSVNKLVGNAWDVQWSMWDEQDRLTQAKQQWEQVLASVDVKELEQYAKRELDEVRATEQTARRKEHDDYFQEAIGLYTQATESLWQLPRLVLVAQAWDKANAGSDRKAMGQYQKEALAQADALATHAAASRAANRFERAVAEYHQAVESITTANAEAARMAETVIAARKNWDAALTNADGKLLTQYASVELTRVQDTAHEASVRAEAGDAEGAVTLYGRAMESLPQLPQLAGAVQVWEKANAGSDRKVMGQYQKEALAQADAWVAQGAASRAARRFELATAQYKRAIELIMTANADAARMAEQVIAARKVWDAALTNADEKMLAQYASVELARVQDSAHEANVKAEAGDAEGAVTLYGRAMESLRPLPQLAGAVQAWEKANAGSDRKVMGQYQKEALAQADALAAQAAASRAAGRFEPAIGQFKQAIESIETANAEAARMARISALLAVAQANDSKENAKVGLAALAQVLQLDPRHAEASRLRRKLLWYDLAMEVGDGQMMRLARIRPGTFDMGSPLSENGRRGDEMPHKMTITRPFAMQTTLVTQGQWKEVMGNNPSHFTGDDNLPVDSVSWNDAVEFCGKVSAMTGKQCRLPTEAEWEYCCRAGTTTPFNTGATISTDQANYDGNVAYGNGLKGGYRQKTTPVEQFPANVWGLHDMHGNLWQWCSDVYGEYPENPPPDYAGLAQSPLASRVLRGGAWSSYSVNCRSANRNGLTPDLRSDIFGFRVVLDSP